VLLLTLASLAWAVYSVSARTVGHRYPLLAWVSLGYVGGMAPYWLWSLPAVLRLDYAALPLWAWIGIAASGLLANLAAYLAWMRGVQLLGAARAGVWQNLAPILGALGGFVFLHERLPGTALLGALLVLLGVYLTQRARAV
jgi:drug/metabolite transporter (DMT)-like permease